MESNSPTPQVCQRFESVRLPPVSSTQSLIEVLTGKLVTNADNITLSKTEVQDIIQQLRLLAESTADGLPCRELVQVKEELKELKFLCQVGDYAGRVFNDLKERWCGPNAPRRADILAQELKIAGPGSAISNAFEKTVSYLPYEDWFEGQMCADTAKLAVHAYSERNLACHSDSIQRKTVGDWHGLGQQISEDLARLREILPDSRVTYETDWRHIINYYRDRYIRQNPEGAWEPLSAEAFPCDPSKPTDVRTLPLYLQHRLFNEGDFRDPVLVEFDAWGRRGATRSDPTQDGKPKRDYDLSEFLDGKPSTKALRADDDASIGCLSKEAKLKKEHKELLFDLHDVLLQITGKDLGLSKSILQRLLNAARESLEEFVGKERGRAAQMAKKLRRKARVTGSSLG